MYRIIGIDHRYDTEYYYGVFTNLGDCLAHMEKLMRSIGNIVRFKCEEV